MTLEIFDNLYPSEVGSCAMNGYEKMETTTEALLEAIRKLIHASDLHSNWVRRMSGLTVPQLLLLNAVKKYPDSNISQLSEKVYLSQATVTIVLDKLESEELAARYRSDVDRRKVHMKLTDKGVETINKAPAPLQSHFIERFEKLKKHEQTAILSTLEYIVDMMENPQQHPASDNSPETSGKMF